jgi:hypothetical protein
MPDISLTEYRNLFSPIEWDEIITNKVLDAELYLKNWAKTLKDVPSIMAYLRDLESLRQKFSDDGILQTVLRIRRSRLAVCSELKSGMRGHSPLKMWSAVGDNYHRRNVRDAFRIGEISIACGRLQGYSSAELSSFILYDGAKKCFLLDVIPDGTTPLAVRLASEYIQLMT